MNQLKFIILITLLFISFKSSAQKTTYIGLEIGPKYDIYQHSDNDFGLYTDPFFASPTVGIKVGKALNKVLNIETGLYINDYWESYKIRDLNEANPSQSNALMFIQIPLRVKANLNLWNKKLFLSPTLGYFIGINSSYHPEDIGTSGTTNSNDIIIQSVSRYNLKKTFGMIEGGLGLNYQLKNNARISIGMNYVKGLSKIIDIDVTYQDINNNTQNANVYSKGSYYSYNIGFTYPLDNLFNKK